jgi:hypothetical protein
VASTTAATAQDISAGIAQEVAATAEVGTAADDIRGGAPQSSGVAEALAAFDGGDAAVLWNGDTEEAIDLSDANSAFAAAFPGMIEAAAVTAGDRVVAFAAVPVSELVVAADRMSLGVLIQSGESAEAVDALRYGNMTEVADVERVQANDTLGHAVGRPTTIHLEGTLRGPEIYWVRVN